MNNFGINVTVRDILKDVGILESTDYLLVSSPVKLTRGKFRYMWNTQVHGVTRKLGSNKKDYLLVGLAVKPGDTVTASNIRHIFRVPAGIVSKIKTKAYSEGKGISSLDSYRVYVKDEKLTGLRSGSAMPASESGSQSEQVTDHTSPGH
mgnify:CR=1 FL=1